MKKEKSEYIVQSVTRALDILEALSDKEDELGVTELSKKLNLHKNNVFRLLVTLESRGYIEQNVSTGNYRLGLKTFELGQIFLHHMGLLKQAKTILKQLVADCDESVYIAILKGENIVYLDMLQTSKSVQIVSRVGSVIPAYCTAIGKAQLAYDSEDELKRIFKQSDLKSFTKNTITSRDKLIKHLKEVAKQGYAIDNEEFEEGVKCIGIPIWDYTHRVVAGICISGPTSRMSDKRIKEELMTLVNSAAYQISHRLGYDIGLRFDEEH